MLLNIFKVFAVQDRFVRQATILDINAAKEFGVAMSMQNIKYADEYYLNISVDYITDDWRITRRSLGFFLLNYKTRY